MTAAWHVGCGHSVQFSFAREIHKERDRENANESLITDKGYDRQPSAYKPTRAVAYRRLRISPLYIMLCTLSLVQHLAAFLDFYCDRLQTIFLRSQNDLLPVRWMRPIEKFTILIYLSYRIVIRKPRFSIAKPLFYLKYNLNAERTFKKNE